ncbi:hypothetical protein [Micromonospora sp. CA-248212]|uniref:hypothetical protein n=1 Tax=Micromonospora sp. CA-248212 TaxID=3239961 RepID=UPI003D8E6B8A
MPDPSAVARAGARHLVENGVDEQPVAVHEDAPRAEGPERLRWQPGGVYAGILDVVRLRHEHRILQVGVHATPRVTITSAVVERLMR